MKILIKLLSIIKLFKEKNYFHLIKNNLIMQKLNNNQPLYIDLYKYENEVWRVYDSKIHSCEHILLNEMTYFLKNFLQKGLKLFFVKTTHYENNKIYKEDLDFFRKKGVLTESKNMSITDNLVKLRNQQSDDLLFFYDTLICEMFCIFSEITDGCYHYNLLIAVKSDFDLNTLYKKKFNLINIITINQIYERDITYDYMGVLFNFEKLVNYSFSLFHEDSYMTASDKDNIEYKNSKEYINYENFTKKYKYSEYISNIKLYEEYLYLLNEEGGKFSEIYDQRSYCSYVFKNFGWHIYVLNYEFSDNIYYLTPALKHHSKIMHTYNYNICFFVKEYGIAMLGENIPDYYDKGYTPGCLLDLVSILTAGDMDEDFSFNISINEISVPKIKYGTNYKQRLRLFENKNDKK